MKYEYEGDLLVVATYPNDGKVRYTYDLLDRVVSTTDARGATSYNHYDTNGHLQKRIAPKCYEAAGAEGVGYEYIYDLQGRLTTTIGPTGQVV